MVHVISISQASIHDPNVTLVDLPRRCKSISCEFIFRKKMRTNETIENFKAKLVVVGYGDLKEEIYMQ